MTRGALARLLATALAALCAGCGAEAPAPRADACDLVAAPSGSDEATGSAADPFRTVQQLLDELESGRTGCLRAGTYTTERDNGIVGLFRRAGRPDARITLRSWPGERATVAGALSVPREAAHVTIAGLDIRDPIAYDVAQQLTIDVLAPDTIIEGNRISNGNRKICLLLGKPGWGRAERTIVRRNRFDGCGRPRPEMRDHGIYVQHSIDVRIEENVITRSGAYAVQLYPDAQRTAVRHNVMHDNGGGVIVGGEDDDASSNNRIEGNIITANRRAGPLEVYWGGPTGHGNIAAGNCLGAPVGDFSGLELVDNVVDPDPYAGGDPDALRPGPDSPCRPMAAAVPDALR